MNKKDFLNKLIKEEVDKYLTEASTDKILGSVDLGLNTMSGNTSLVKYIKDNKIKFAVTDVYYGQTDSEDDYHEIGEIEKYSVPLDDEDIRQILELLKK